MISETLNLDLSYYNLFILFVLIIAGILSGFVNTIAGGGSVITLPALMLIGIPADIANGTNRVGILLQSIAGVREFKKSGALDTNQIRPILIPTLLGGAIGAITASFLEITLLKPILIITTLIVTLIVVFKPNALPTAGENNLSIEEKPVSLIWLLLAGFYGGFIQAGVGIILVVIFSSVLRYSILNANALKVSCALAFTIIALMIFALRGQVNWIPGLILGVSSIIGVKLSLNFAAKVDQMTLKWILLLLSLVICITALLKK